MVRMGSRGHDTLPAEVTSLVGRQGETARVRQLLTGSRLVTLTGPGGVGKTRLAVHVARTVRGAFTDGVHLVALADLSQADLVVSTVVAMVDPDRASGGVEEAVAAIGGRRLLLVLDNCEHLADACAELVTVLLRSCPRLCILATSREALRVDGEALFQVPPLALPEPGGAVTAEHPRVFDSVALFLERAAALNPDVAAGRVDEAAVAELCRRLDGLPLAIELAAAASRWLPVETILAQSSDPLASATDAPRGTETRHRSLTASLDYSYELCSPPARTLWARLSVFRGGATLQSVLAVCSAPDLRHEDVIAALRELVDKSIVILHGSRYSMLETIRRYGERLLAEAGERQRVGAAHLGHMQHLADEVGESWFGPDQITLLGRVLADQANVRAALELALSDPALVGSGLRIASSLWTFWISSGLPAEGRRWLGRLLEEAEPTDPARPAALWTQGFLCAVDGDIPVARRIVADSLATATARGDHASAARAQCTLGVADLFEGRIDSAIAHLEEGVTRQRALTSGTPYLADALINLGLAYCYRGDLERAGVVLDEARELCLARGEQLLMSWVQSFRALRAVLDGRPREAATLARDSLERKRALDLRQGLVWSVEVFAWAVLEDGDPQRAAVLLGATEARAADLGPAFHGFAGMGEWHARYLRRAAEALTPATFRAALRDGARLSIDELAAVALGASPEALPQERSALDDSALTPRKREIARLVATGRTNREIADELVIAPRTVDTHVQRILAKLDFTSRSQVVALLLNDRAGSA
jgi:predicted ATPase/DNA-binding CsgD family transcriptional regulator